MTQKRKVGPGGGDFALNPNKFSGGGGGKSIVTGKKSTVSKKSKEKLEKKKKREKAKQYEFDELLGMMREIVRAKKTQDYKGSIFRRAKAKK
tara:strand:+ start:805 stop:1080 length:276 start_codon:yes stop_codon:yes gene_type:complete